MPQLDAKFLDDAFAVIAQTKARFGNAGSRQQVGGYGAALGVMQLKHPCTITRGELQHMRPIGRFTHTEGGLGFGVKAPST